MVRQDMLDTEAKKMKKATKKKTPKKTTKKPVKTAFISHLHVGNRLALTVWAQQVPDRDICCLGMSLVHASDSGSRKDGRMRAFDRCLQGMIDFDNNQKSLINPPPAVKPGLWASVVNLFKGNPPAQEIKDLAAELDAKGIIGGRGCWLVKGLQNAKIIVENLREWEKTSNSDSAYFQNATRDAYYDAFFRLPNRYCWKVLQAHTDCQANKVK